MDSVVHHESTLQVSIYGHSLGSVLSYDILCHQDTLHSPFPMEWMYKEREKSETHKSMKDELSSNYNPTSDVGEHPTSDVGNEKVENSGGESVVTDADKEREKSEVQCSMRDESSLNCDPTSDVGEDPTAVERVPNSGGESVVSDADNPDLVDEHAEGVCHQFGPPALSESDESTTNDAFTSDENHDKSLESLNDRECSKPERISNPRSMKSEIVPCDEDPSGENITDNDNDDIISSLREEVVTVLLIHSAFLVLVSLFFLTSPLSLQIELLKSRIEQFEAETADIGMDCVISRWYMAALSMLNLE